MILRKYMSLLGIGSANIDLVLPKEMYKPGESVQGSLVIKGGIIEQQLKRIDCEFIMNDKASGKEQVIDAKTILTTRRIQAEESKEISFGFTLPDFVRESTESISYYFKTRLTFNEGIHSRDQDVIYIVQ
ncbi:sporulation protein [Peribacillus sp. SCS-155]|uniref:sporulation protein n=1 Tax=Peribacillus sedimenti TaxID=3115297 RepID=UPI0039058BCA